MKKVRELSLILIVIGIIFVILSIGITPQIVDEVLLADRQIDSVYLQKLWIYRIVFFLIGGLLLSIGLLWGKHYKKILKFFDKHRVALSVKHGRIILAIGLGFHTFIYLLKTKYNAFFIDNKWYFAPLREDIMISMRYAYNLANGYGLVWNIGERVEGYTNFLWTIILAIPHFFNIPTNISFLFPVICNYVFFIVSLTLIFKLLSHLTYSPVSAFLGAAILCFFLPYIYWGSMGFETSILVLCSASSLYFIAKGLLSNGRNLPYFLAAFALGLAWLCRDSYALIIFTSVVPLFVLWLMDKFVSLRQIAIILFIPFFMKFIHLAFRFWYYGSLLPNTYYLKATNWDKMDQLSQGWEYTLAFYKLLVPILILFVFAFTFCVLARDWKIKIGRPVYIAIIGISLFTVLVQTFYVTWVGGDVFNNFRFYVILVPYLAVLVGIAVDILGKSTEQQTISFSIPVILLIIITFLFLSFSKVDITLDGASPFVHINTKARANETLVQFMDLVQISELNEITAPEKNIRTAITIRDNVYFEGSRSIAVYFAGTLPYLLGSEYQYIDLLGKMDPYIAKQEAKVGFSPGHNKWDMEYSLNVRRPQIVLSLLSVDEDKQLEQQFQNFQNRNGFGGALFKENSFMSDYYLAHKVDRGFDIYSRNEIILP